MKSDDRWSKAISVLSWVLLVASLVTAGALAAGILWLASCTVLVADTCIEAYRGLSLSARYFEILRDGFLNALWLSALGGIIIVWYFVLHKGAVAKRVAVAISMILVHRWLQLTLVFQMLFSRFTD